MTDARLKNHVDAMRAAGRGASYIRKQMRIDGYEESEIDDAIAEVDREYEQTQATKRFRLRLLFHALTATGLTGTFVCYFFSQYTFLVVAAPWLSCLLVGLFGLLLYSPKRA